MDLSGKQGNRELVNNAKVGVIDLARLRNKLLAYFKPANYDFKTRWALSFWVSKNTVTNYINGFNERYI